VPAKRINGLSKAVSTHVPGVLVTALLASSTPASVQIETFVPK
jgi:hypothetical protein